MRKLQCIAATAAMSAIFTLAGTSAQTPSTQQPGRPSAAQRKPSGIQILLGAATDNLVLESTGKPVDKAAVKAREESEAESNQLVSEGEAFLKVGKTQEAIVSYQNALVVTPTDGLAYRRLAEAYTTSGKLDEASQTFRKVLIEGFGPGIGNGVGGTANIWAEYALVLLKTKQDAEAVQAYNHAVYLLDYEVSGPRKGEQMVKVLLPELAAEPTSSEQVQYTPERLQALADTILADNEMGLGNNADAIASMKEAAKLYPDSAVIQYYLGEALDHSYYIVLDSPVKDKTALWAAYKEDKKARVAAYKKAAELGDDATVAAAKERIATLR